MAILNVSVLCRRYPIRHYVSLHLISAVVMVKILMCKGEMGGGGGGGDM